MERQENGKSEAATEDFMASMAEYRERQKREMREFAQEYGIRDLDEEAIEELGNVRRPLVLVRGRPITVEQTKRLITGEEPLFGDGSEKECTWFDPRQDRGILKNIFYRQGYDWLSTWVYSDGTIGGNLIFLGKYPDWDELMPPYMHLAERYPFLDLVISYTLYDENCCYGCFGLDGLDEGYIKFCECKDCMPYRDKISKYSSQWTYNRDPEFEELYYRSWECGHVRSDVSNSVVLTIWVHGGRTDVLFGREAAEKFDEYDKLYCAPEYAFMFSSELYSSNKTCICSKAFVEECFEYIGKPRSLCDEYVSKGFISPFHEGAEVVTKEWVIQKYRECFGDGI